MPSIACQYFVVQGIVWCELCTYSFIVYGTLVVVQCCSGGYSYLQTPENPEESVQHVSILHTGREGMKTVMDAHAHTCEYNIQCTREPSAMASTCT